MILTACLPEDQKDTTMTTRMYLDCHGWKTVRDDFSPTISHWLKLLTRLAAGCLAVSVAYDWFKQKRWLCVGAKNHCWIFCTSHS